MARDRNRDDDRDEPRRRRRDDDSDEAPRPRRRGDEDDEGISKSPRARRRREDDEDDRVSEAPRARRRPRDDEDDYDERPRRRRRIVRDEPTGLDATFANTNIVMLVLFACLCGDIALLLGIIGLVVCKNDKARTNALIVTAISAVRVAVLVIAIIASNLKK
jgi:hypothetical protein